jgi:hypothetical protein
MFDDLSTLQKRIMNLENKIKQDNVGMQKVREERNETFKGIIKMTQNKEN